MISLASIMPGSFCCCKEAEAQLNGERQRVRKLELSLETERQTTKTLKDQLGRADQQTTEAVQQLRTALDSETKHCKELHEYSHKFIVTDGFSCFFFLKMTEIFKVHQSVCIVVFLLV